MPTAGDIYYFVSKGGKPTKPPVVFIHGAGGNCTHWPHNLRRLPRYHIYAIDLPGHGKSGGLGEQSIEAYAKIVHDWMQAVGLYQAVFVGHSMGGAIALTMALEYRERVLGLGLVATGARLRVNPQILDKLSMEKTSAAGVRNLVGMHFANRVGAALQSKIYEQLLQTRATVMHGDYVACNGFDVMDRLGEIKAPTTVICGSEDVMTPPKYSEYLAGNIRKSNLTVIPRAGHMVELEQPERVAKEVETFLKSVPY